MLKVGGTTRHRIGVAAAVAISIGATGVTPAGATTRHTLTRRQVDRIVAMTGYHGLRSHRFDVAGAFETRPAKVVVIRLDHARLEVPLSEVHADIRRAERLASARRTFTTTIKVGHGPRQRITYEVVPTSGRHHPDLRYVIFSPHRERLAALTRPEQVPPKVQALTVISGQRLNVTLLHDGSPSASLDSMVECLNTSSHVYVTPQTLNRLQKQQVDLSYLTDPNHPHPTRRHELANLASRGLEIWSNSLGFAILAARRGTSYQQYAHQVPRMRFGFYRRNDLRYLKVSPRQYRRLG